MKIIKKSLFLLFFIGLQVQAMENTIAVPSSFDNETITSDNIIQLAPHTPKKIEKKVQKWLKKNPTYSATALGYESFVPTEQREYQGKMYWTIRPLVEKTNEMLEKMGTPNISPFNYVHEFCKDKSWLIKIAGHINRKYNISHLAQALKFGGSFWGKEGYDYQYVLSPEDYTLMRESLDDSHFDKVIEKNKEIVIENAPKTYQHISRMAAYLLFLEAHKKNNFSKVKMPEMYLVHVPGRPKEVSDRNYIMLEKKLVSLEDLKDVTQEEEQQLQNAIKATGIFSINTDNCKRDTTDNTIVILDTEQPNNSLPTEFFHQNEKVIQGNIGGALFELNKMIQKIREQGSEIQENK